MQALIKKCYWLLVLLTCLLECKYSIFKAVLSGAVFEIDKCVCVRACMRACACYLQLEFCRLLPLETLQLPWNLESKSSIQTDLNSAKNKLTSDIMHSPRINAVISLQDREKSSHMYRHTHMHADTRARTHLSYSFCWNAFRASKQTACVGRCLCSNSGNYNKFWIQPHVPTL